MLIGSITPYYSWQIITKNQKILNQEGEQLA